MDTSCCHSSVWSGCEGRLCQYFGKSSQSTQLPRADASSAARTRSRRTIVPTTKETVIAILSSGKSSSWQSARSCEGTSEVRRRDGQVYDLRSELSRQTKLGRRYTTAEVENSLDSISTCRTGWGNTAISRDVWRISSCSSSHWTRNWTPSRSGTSTRSTPSKNDRARSDDPISRNRIILESNESRTAAESHHKLDATIKSRNIWHSKSSKRSTDNTRFTKQLGRSKIHFELRCLCWWNYHCIDIICQQRYGTSNQHKLVATPSCFYTGRIHCRKQLQN